MINVGLRYIQTIALRSMVLEFKVLPLLFFGALSSSRLPFFAALLPNQHNKQISPDPNGLNSALVSPDPVPNGITTHIAFVRANGGTKLFVNGNLVSYCRVSVCGQ